MMSSKWLLGSCGIVCLLWTATVGAQIPGTLPTEGLHVAKSPWVAIRNATLHVNSQETIAEATLLIQGTKIVGVGRDLEIPPGCRIIDGTGRHVYAGFIDAYLPLTPPDLAPPAANYWNSQIRPDRDMSQHVNWTDAKLEERRKLGFTSALVAPNSGIIQGRSAVYQLRDNGSRETLVRRDVGLHCLLTMRFGMGGGDARSSSGPTSPMGAYALARQTFLDAQWYRDAWQVARIQPDLPRPETNESLELLEPALRGDLPLFVNASNELFVLRSARFAREFGLRLVVIGSGNEYRRCQEIAALKVPLIVPLDFPSAPSVDSPPGALNASLEELMHWDHAPENAARLVQARVPLAFTTQGLTNLGDFGKNLRTAVRRGLSEADALRALTETPAEILQVDDQLGTLEPGKLASFFWTDGSVFADKTKVLGSCVGGVWYDFSSPPLTHLGGQWKISWNDHPAPAIDAPSPDYIVLHTEGKVAGVIAPEAVTAETATGTVSLQKISAKGSQWSATFAGQTFGFEGIASATITVDTPNSGSIWLVWPDGTAWTGKLERLGDAPPLPKRGGEGNRGNSGESSSTAEPAENPGWELTAGIPHGGHFHFLSPLPTSPAAGASVAGASGSDPFGNETAEDNYEWFGNTAVCPPDDAPVAALYPINYPLGDFGRQDLPPVETVLFKNVTVWTLDEQGVIENGQVLIRDGIIAEVLPGDAESPPADVVIDGEGRHLTPGLIDCHSHMATDSGVNEVGQAITAEVRIGDFIDCDDITIYRQLAGGLTTSSILHGSANPIGGQNQVIKLRWGQNDEGLKFAEAPAGIKFALGENVKGSNRREPSTRYPQTRLGVEQLMHDTFRAAQDYRRRQAEYRLTRNGLPPRVDLELEAISEILEGTRWIHCHSYRQDEVLALIRVLDHFQITIGSFQHILEGYKVADAIREHGGTASCFSDWWAYKYEVIDAIPQAGALMHAEGLVVSFNSDDGELARHMNHEAAKAVRYGGVSEVEALKFVTLNPAKQLRIDPWVGSIEVGKHADLVLWSGHPLALDSRCEQTWIDGRRYFDREQFRLLAEEQRRQKAALIQRILSTGATGSSRERSDDSQLWPRFDEFCHDHGQD